MAPPRTVDYDVETDELALLQTLEGGGDEDDEEEGQQQEGAEDAGGVEAARRKQVRARVRSGRRARAAPVLQRYATPCSSPGARHLARPVAAFSVCLTSQWSCQDGHSYPVRCAAATALLHLLPQPSPCCRRQPRRRGATATARRGGAGRRTF